MRSKKAENIAQGLSEQASIAQGLAEAGHEPWSYGQPGVTIFFLDGEIQHALSSAVDASKLGFPVFPPDPEGNNQKIHVSMTSVKYIVFEGGLKWPAPHGDPREAEGLPKIVVHFQDHQTLRTFEDDFFMLGESGYSCRIYDAKDSSLKRCLISQYGIKAIYHVNSFDSRDDHDRLLLLPIEQSKPYKPPVAILPASVVNTQLFDLAEQLRVRLFDYPHPGLSSTVESEFKEAVVFAVDALLREDQSSISAKDKEEVVGYIMRAAIGFGPIDRLLSDPSVTEVMVNGPKEIWVERYGKLERIEGSFRDEVELLEVIRKMAMAVGRRIDTSNPSVDARLADGSRINAIIPPVSLRGPVLTVRKFSPAMGTLDALLKTNTFSPQMALFLRTCIAARLNILITGGAGSGKTTTLNALAGLVPYNQRLITIEDSAELQIPHPHVIPMEARMKNVEGRGAIGISDLLRNALRMRPDRIIVGECRGGETLDMLQAMNTGHDGSMTTIHANSARDAFSRLETMVLQANEMPLPAVRRQIASAIDIVVHQRRSGGGSRQIVQIAEVVGFDESGPKLRDLYLFDPVKDAFVATGEVSSRLIEKAERYRVAIDPSLATPSKYS